MLKTLFLNYRTLSVLNTDIGRQVDALNSYPGTSQLIKIHEQQSAFSFVRQLTTRHCPHSAARLLVTAGRLAVQQSIDVSWAPGPQQQTRSSGGRRPDGTDGQTDARQLSRPVDSAAHIVRTDSAKLLSLKREANMSL